jgi:hypothetical protein
MRLSLEQLQKELSKNSMVPAVLNIYRICFQGDEPESGAVEKRLPQAQFAGNSRMFWK